MKILKINKGKIFIGDSLENLLKFAIQLNYAVIEKVGKYLGTDYNYVGMYDNQNIVMYLLQNDKKEDAVITKYCKNQWCIMMDECNYNEIDFVEI